MRIAVTSQNFRTVTGHAGKTRRFLVYEGVPGLTPKEVKRLDLPRELSIHETPPNAMHPLDSVQVLITGGCGEGFFRKMARRGVKVVVTEEEDPLTAVRQVIEQGESPLFQ